MIEGYLKKIKCEGAIYVIFNKLGDNSKISIYISQYMRVFQNLPLICVCVMNGRETQNMKHA